MFDLRELMSKLIGKEADNGGANVNVKIEEDTTGDSGRGSGGSTDAYLDARRILSASNGRRTASGGGGSGSTYTPAPCACNGKR